MMEKFNPEIGQRFMDELPLTIIPSWRPKFIVLFPDGSLVANTG